MQSFFYHVLSDSRVYDTLTAEIEAAVRNNTIPDRGNLSWNESQHLPYFQACLREAMRVRPAVGLNITRLVPPEGVELDGRFFAGGTRIAVNGWVLHRDRAVFGDDVDDYRPERWLASEESAKKMDRYMFQVRRLRDCSVYLCLRFSADTDFFFQFGGGSHLCIGRNLALLEINKVIPRLLRDYRFRLAHPGRPLKAFATFFVVQEGLEVYAEKAPSR